MITSFPSLFPPHLFLIGAAFSVEPRAVLTLLSSSLPNYPRGVERNGFGNKTRKKTRCLTGRGKSGLDDLPLLPPSLPSFPHISSEKKTENREYPANGPYNFTKRRISCAFYKKRVFYLELNVLFSDAQEPLRALVNSVLLYVPFFKKYKTHRTSFVLPSPTSYRIYIVATSSSSFCFAKVER